jgi:two-component sensor histidine kinase/CHASE3 domain sensor protein
MSDAASTDIGMFRMPSREIRRQFLIALSLVLVTTAAIASLFIVRGVDAQMRDVQHTYEVRRQAGALIQSLTDAETGQRGFLLTQDRAYLEPYQLAVASLDTTYRNLMTLVADMPHQKSQIGAIAESIEQKRAEMATTITMAGDGRLPEALSILRTDTGRTLMTTIRETLLAFIAEEDAKLLDRNDGVDAARLWLIATIILALGGAALLAYALLSTSQRQVLSLAQTSSELASMNAELERRVQARTAELEESRAHAERERARVELLLQDTNHRVGNSLATVSSLLGLQVARTRSAEVRSALESAQNRVHAIASGHRRLRLGSDFETVNAAEFIKAVVDDLRVTQAAGRDVAFETNVEPLVIHGRDATTLGIIVGELVINALKHAFPDGGAGTISTGFSRGTDGAPVLVVEDDGRGIDPEVLHAETGLGAMIIRQLATQFGGEPSYAAREGGGTRFTLKLPNLKAGGVVLDAVRGP